MTRIALPKTWLVEQPLNGLWALAGGIAAVGLPTLIRASVDADVPGCATIPYVPFIILSAVLLGWRHAAAVALASAVAADVLFMGPHSHALMESECDLFGVTGLLVTSAMIIGFVTVARSSLRDLIDEHRGGIVFSLRDGQTWASWYGHKAPVHLGTEKEVSEMMRDFLDQNALAERLLARKS